jgi:DNA-binding NtrC family response regulator
VQRVGSHRTRRLDLRVVAATNRDLTRAVKQGQFREDLFYRLAAMPIHLPPLRDRTGDIRMLACHFLDQFATRYRKTVRGFSTTALEVLERHPWPGNVRELAHVIERAVLLCSSDRIQLSELPGFSAPPEEDSLGSALRAEKRRRAEAALFRCGGNQAAAARLLGMSRSNFARLVKTLGVRHPLARPD